MPQFASVVTGFSKRPLFPTGDLLLPSIFRLPLIWVERAHFRARLRDDLKNEPYLLRDIGIRVGDAQAEAVRFFWEPVLLKSD